MAHHADCWHAATSVSPFASSEAIHIGRGRQRNMARGAVQWSSFHVLMRPHGTPLRDGSPFPSLLCSSTKIFEKSGCGYKSISYR